MEWKRIKYAGTKRLMDGYVRHYLDGVRSDGFLFRAGIDILASSTIGDAAIKNMLADSLNAFLEKKNLGQLVGVDAFRSEDGWNEVV